MKRLILTTNKKLIFLNLMEMQCDALDNEWNFQHKNNRYSSKLVAVSSLCQLSFLSLYFT